MKLILPLIVTALGTHKAMGFALLRDFGDPYCFETDAEDCVARRCTTGMAAAADAQIACRHTARAASAVWNVLRPTNLTASIPVAILRVKLTCGHSRV